MEDKVTNDIVDDKSAKSDDGKNGPVPSVNTRLLEVDIIAKGSILGNVTIGDVARSGRAGGSTIGSICATTLRQSEPLLRAALHLILLSNRLEEIHL